MGKVMEKLKEDLQSIVITPELIHYQDFVMGGAEGSGGGADGVQGVPA